MKTLTCEGVQLKTSHSQLKVSWQVYSTSILGVLLISLGLIETSLVINDFCQGDGYIGFSNVSQTLTCSQWHEITFSGLQ